ncbi:sulfate ABC transporter permease subunit CysT [Luteolibacter sp. LG18]|uniref:ABC transporter permease n=1 Tax=Luteolibacter sp. LG18 TaxID=2819286 RepID=UPI002B2B6647|nr:sulfate ABC transporter permease [Luteolibacter sp. LG18]
MSRRRIIPGFGLSLGYTITYLSVIILIPLAALFLKASQMDMADAIKLLKSPAIVAAAKLSFGASALAAVFSSVLGLLVAWVLVRYRFPGRKLFDAMVDLPFALPTAVAGITLTQIYSNKGWVGQYLANGAKWLKENHHPGGWLGEWVDTVAQRGAAYSSIGVFIALFFIGLPFVVRTVQPVMEDLSRDTEEAAATLGAGRWTVFWRVIFPSILPALITGFTLAFARAVGEYGSVIFISGNLPLKTEILPSLIISQLEQFKYESAAVIAAAMLLVSFALLFIINLLQRRLNWRTR